MKEYCEKHGNEEMENIKKAIEEKHQKELQTKKGLENASEAFKSYKLGLLQQRHNIHKQQQVEFARKQGELAKAEILEDAKKQLVIIKVKRLNEEAAAERKKKDIAKMALEKSKGNVTVYEGKGDDSQEAWGKGS